MLNVVTGEDDEAAAVLIRGVEGFSGPGRVGAKLGIGPSLHGKPASRATGLWFEFAPEGAAIRVRRTPRIGVDYAGPIWAEKKLRFIRIN